MKAGLYITFWAAPGKIEELVQAVQSMLPVAEGEAGTLAYGFHRVSAEHEGVSVYEIYEDAAAQRVHGSSPQIEALRPRLASLLAAAPERHVLAPIAGSKGLPF